MKLILSEVREVATLRKAHTSPKIFQVKQAVGEDTVKKLFCLIIRSFQDSLKITTPENKLDASEIYDAAIMLMNRYTHESVYDVLCAMRVFKESGKPVYNRFSEKDLIDIMADYLEAKSDFLEKENRFPASGSSDRSETSLTIEQVREQYLSLRDNPQSVAPETKKADENNDDEYSRFKAEYISRKRKDENDAY